MGKYKARMICLAGHVVYMGEMRTVYKILVGKLHGNKSKRTSRHK
jgi:hypothetical protein